MGAGSVDAEVEAAAHTLEELEDRVRDMKAALAGAAAAAEASARAFRGATQAVVAMASRDAPAFDHFRATDAASDTGHVAVAGRLCAMWNRVVVGKADVSRVAPAPRPSPLLQPRPPPLTPFTC